MRGSRLGDGSSDLLHYLAFRGHDLAKKRSMLRELRLVSKFRKVRSATRASKTAS